MFAPFRDKSLTGFAATRKLPSSPLQAPIEVKLHTGQAAGLSNGVKEIQDALAEKGWGKDVTVTIIRERQKKEITVTLPPAE